MRQDATASEKAAPKTSFEGRRGPRKGYEGIVSAGCKKNKHWQCYKLDCPCECHRVGVTTNA